LNIAVLCADRKNITAKEEKLYVYIDWVLQWVFLAEVIFKVINKSKMLYHELEGILYKLFFVNVLILFLDLPSQKKILREHTKHLGFIHSSSQTRQL